MAAIMTDGLAEGTGAAHATETVADLVPARMLNEFAYCPRLAYLEWVRFHGGTAVAPLKCR